MGIAEQVKDALASEPRGREEHLDAQRVNARLESLAARGLLVRKSYQLPPLDTVGFGAATESSERVGS